MTLTFLDGAVHDFEHLWTVAFDCASACSKCDKRGALASENCILATVYTVHKVLDRSRAQTDETVVLRHAWFPRYLIGQVQSEAIIANLIILDSHLFQKVDLLVSC